MLRQKETLGSLQQTDLGVVPDISERLKSHFRPPVRLVRFGSPRLRHVSAGFVRHTIWNQVILKETEGLRHFLHEVENDRGYGVHQSMQPSLQWPMIVHKLQPLVPSNDGHVGTCAVVAHLDRAQGCASA